MEFHSNALYIHIVYVCHDMQNKSGWMIEHTAPNERSTPKIEGYLFQQAI